MPVTLARDSRWVEPRPWEEILGSKSLSAFSGQIKIGAIPYCGGHGMVPTLQTARQQSAPSRDLHQHSINKTYQYYYKTLDWRTSAARSKGLNISGESLSAIRNTGLVCCWRSTHAVTHPKSLGHRLAGWKRECSVSAYLHRIRSG